VAITRNGSDRVAHSGLTKNVSSGGVLFSTNKESDPGGAIEYVIKLAGSAGQGVTLRCIGKVLRCARGADPEQSVFDVAATMERYEFVRSEA